jgi:tetratricopeptide (TPR) repeat protein
MDTAHLGLPTRMEPQARIHDRPDVAPFVPAIVSDWISAEPEAMHRTISGSLLRVAHTDRRTVVSCTGHGGDLLRSIDGELLFLFSGRRHRARATRAVRSIGPSASLESGIIDLFLVGCEHRELFVCRPRPGRRTSPSKGVGSERDATHLRSCVPSIVRGGLASGRRDAAVAWLHLANLDDLLEQHGPDVTGRHLADLVHRIDRVFAEHDVAFIASDVAEGGPLILCATGIVRRKDNDEPRLVRALREVIDYPTAIELRIGIDRGPVYASYTGDGTRRTLALRGHAVRSAAALSARAGSSEIVTSTRVFHRAGTLLTGAERVDGAYRSTKPPHLRHGVVNMLLNLGRLAFEHHDFDAAKHYFEEGLRLSVRTASKRDEALLRHGLAETALAMRDAELALQHCDAALAITRDAGDTVETAAALVTLGLARSADGDAASARFCWRYAVETLGGSMDEDENPLARARDLLAAARRSAAASSSGG